jgi:hypothetical protein
MPRLNLSIVLSHQTMSLLVVLGTWPSSGDAVPPPDSVRATPQYANDTYHMLSTDLLILQRALRSYLAAPAQLLARVLEA